jgi:hypothetical protein
MSDVSEQQAAARTGRPRRRQTVGDMVRSMALVLVLVGVAVVFYLAGRPDPVVREVQYTDALALARQTASYDVLAPDPLPDGWRATSARARSEGDVATWHLGLVTAAGSYAAVEQSDGDRRDFVARFAEGARRSGTTSIDGTTWRRLVGGEPEERALLRTAGGVTTLVAGGAQWAELEQLAATLRGE